MMRIESGQRVGDFIVGECLHSGGMAWIYAADFAGAAPSPDFPLVMKVPRMAAGDGAENLLGFEIEKQILASLNGPHAPRFVAAGDVTQQPFLVMERVVGETLQDWLDRQPMREFADIARVGVRIAHALHWLHQQGVCHLDLKPANIMLQENGNVLLLDFGLSHSTRFPDLLAEERRSAAGSNIWIAPEQVVGIRGDPRSDIFALGVILYELCTGTYPFGDPQTPAGVRQRLWMQPSPPRALNAGVPPWLQEIVLCCLQATAEQRYESAASLAFDLAHPDQVRLGPRAGQTQRPGFWRQVHRWFNAGDYRPSPLAGSIGERATIVLVAVPRRDASEATLDALRQAVRRSLGNRPGARLACISVIAPGGLTNAAHTEIQAHQQALAGLRQWLAPLDIGEHLATFHALESGDVAQAILNFARDNRVDLIVMGAATHGLQLQHLIATVPVRVAMAAPCTVMLVKA